MDREINMHHSLSASLHDLLSGTGLTAATAESCTGGAVAAAIVAVSGASEYFKGGIVSYCNEIKERLLGVSRRVLEEQTAVCEEVAREMALGARKALGTDYAVSVTGTAGPGGGTDAIPVGTIWIGVAGPGTSGAVCLRGDRGRGKNLSRAVTSALELLVETVRRDREVEKLEKL